MIISLGSDHAGFEQKDALAAFLVDEGHDVVDRGPENDVAWTIPIMRFVLRAM